MANQNYRARCTRRCNTQAFFKRRKVFAMVGMSGEAPGCEPAFPTREPMVRIERAGARNEEDIGLTAAHALSPIDLQDLSVRT
jgi:hypothetical protein